MKRLLLIRHAKAVHNPSYQDFERPLKPSGIRDAEAMAEKLKHEKVIPQVLISSPSLRTLSTANIFSEFLSLSKAQEDRRIYDASRLTMLQVINEIDNKYDFAGLVGHNPSIEQIFYYLTGDQLDFRPGAVALIEFDTDNWELITDDTGKLLWHASPKDD
jgi:phosphohistidine phosphatase